MVALRCFFAIKINLVQCIPCGQYILVDRFLRNSGYLVKHEVLATFGCQFSSKRSFECGQYILANRFLRNSGYLVEREVLSTFRCQFSSKRSFEKSKNIKVCLNLTLKWWH